MRIQSNLIFCLDASVGILLCYLKSYLNTKHAHSHFVFVGDILENYCHNDDLINVARFLFAITIMLTYPIECFVTREVTAQYLC